MTRGAKIWIGIAAVFGTVVFLWGALNVTDTIQQFRLPSESMEPTYDVGDRVMVGRNGFPFGKAGRGDVVITWAPSGASDESPVECARQRPAAACEQATPGHTDVYFITVPRLVFRSDSSHRHVCKAGRSPNMRYR